MREKVSFKYRRRTLRLSNSKGVSYLLELLRHPYKPISALQLYAIQNHIPDSLISACPPAIAPDQSFSSYNGCNLIPMTDDKTIREVKQRLIVVREDLLEAKYHQDYARSEDLKDEEEKLLDYLHEVLNHSQRIRFFDTGEKRIILSVHKALQRTLHRIGNHHPEFQSVLTQDLHLWRELCYQPEHTKCIIHG